MSNVSTSAKWIAGVLVSALVIATIVLVTLAIERTRPSDPGDEPDPVPSFSFRDPAPTQSPVESQTPNATPAAADAGAVGAAERFLSVGSPTMWRGTAGACGGTAPTIERSDDGGDSWQDVTPTYREIGALTSLDAFAQTEAEIIASMGPECETQALRTFTQGEFWQPYDDVLASSRYLDPADAATVVTPAGRVATPCASPTSVRAQGAVVALVCDGTAYTLADGGWSPIGTPDILALAVVSGDVLLASTSPECAGITVTRLEGAVTASTSCAADADPSAPLAISGTATDTRLWSGDTVLTLP